MNPTSINVGTTEV